MDVPTSEIGEDGGATKRVVFWAGSALHGKLFTAHKQTLLQKHDQTPIRFIIFQQNPTRLFFNKASLSHLKYMSQLEQRDRQPTNMDWYVYA